MRSRDKRRQRGVALLMVLAAGAILTVLVADLQQNTQTTHVAILRERDAMHAEYLARSGVNLARLFLSLAEPASQMMQGMPFWTFAHWVIAPFCSPEEAEIGSLFGTSFSGSRGMGNCGGSIEIDVVDEESKINVNLGGATNIAVQGVLVLQLAALLAPPIRDFLFEGRDADGQFTTREELIAAILDWTDFDDQIFVLGGGSQGGVEDGFYEMLADPYHRKNAPFDSLEELHLVRGVTEDLWLTLVDPNPDRPAERAMTIWGAGKININTADSLALFAVLCASSSVPNDPLCTTQIEPLGRLISAIMTLRSPPLGLPFARVTDLPVRIAMAGTLDPSLPNVTLDATRLGTVADVQSHFFSIYATGVVGEGARQVRRRIHAVLDSRNALAGGTIVYWRVE